VQALSGDRINDNYDNNPPDFDGLGQASVILLPTMFKFVTDAHTDVSKSRNQKEGDAMNVEETSSASTDKSTMNYQQLQDVTDAISALAPLAPNDFLLGMFKKVMHRLLEEIQSESCDNERVCSLLSLSQALVSSKVLDESNVAFLYRALKTMIKNDEHGPRVQKRAYKLLAEICQRHHSFVAQPEQLKELISLLTGSIMTSQVAARHMRLKCISMLVEGMDGANTDQMVSIFSFLNWSIQLFSHLTK
jgi:ribosomal RNA-processing protein 12